jgi:hypothetical protein
MVKKERYIKTYSALLPLEEYLEKYESKPNDWWYEFFVHINNAFNIKTDDNYKSFLEEMWLTHFDYQKMKKVYDEIKIDLGFFDDDILKFIAFIAALGYFERIGNPSWYVWLNARDLNRPLEECGEYNGLSIIEVMGLKYGTNAIKNSLSSTLKFCYF